MNTLTLRTFVLCALLATSLFAADTESSTAGSSSWSSKSAAAYLDGRLDWWMNWSTAARDHDTFCVSCHTALPYAMARPALRSALGERAPSPTERKLLDNVTKRVRMWKEVEPFYPDALRGVPKTAESRGTESILNAVILANYDQSNRKLSADARLALDNMWSQQVRTGKLGEPGNGCNSTMRRGKATRNTSAPRWPRWLSASRPEIIGRLLRSRTV